MSKPIKHIYNNMVKPFIDDRASKVSAERVSNLIKACNWIEIIANEFETYGAYASIDKNNDIIVGVTLEDMVVENSIHAFYRVLQLVDRLDIEYVDEYVFNMKFAFHGICD